MGEAVAAGRVAGITSVADSVVGGIAVALGACCGRSVGVGWSLPAALTVGTFTGLAAGEVATVKLHAIIKISTAEHQI